MKIVLFMIILLVVLLAAVGYGMAGYSMQIKRQTLEEARAWQEDHYDLSWYDGLRRESYTVTSDDGYRLYAEMLYNEAPSDRCVIISHGYTDNRYGALKYAKMYLDLGFHVIVYDLRGHGVNEPTFCTYSARERRDLRALIEDARTRWPEIRILGLHGESLGCATSMAVLEYKPAVDFVVGDCGFSAIDDVLKGGLRQMHIPGVFVDLASLFAKLRYGYSYQEMRPVDCVTENDVPILLIHGADDTFITPEHSRRMQAATRGYSELYLIDGAGHAMSILTDPDAYRTYVADFLTAIGL